MSLSEQSNRARAISDSVTLAIAAKARELRSQGLDVISLSAGEPDFGTVETVAAAGVEAIHSGQTRYTAAAGTPELRAAASAWFSKTYGLEFSPAEVMVTAGAKPALHMALMATVNPGDPVLIPAPYWVSYPDLVRIADGTPTILDAVPDQHFIHSGEQILAAAREHGAKGLILNYPGNPSGAVPTREQLGAIVDACVEADLWILSDEIYGQLIYDGVEHCSPAAFEQAKGRVMVVNGGSKSHSMTGWRVGFLAGPKAVVQAASRLQSQVIGNACSISQAAALQACEGDHRDEMQRRLRAFDERRHFMVEQINNISGLKLTPPKGAFYAMVDARQLCSLMHIDDVGLAERLLADALLAVVPGSAFALPGFIRLSYATSMDDLQKAVERLRDFAARG
ncbi:MAG: pyridoxal phosphate-dependent aminotransferase [Planctomycetota bacterium]|jgi:aspartate aminotransferase